MHVPIVASRLLKREEDTRREDCAVINLPGCDDVSVLSSRDFPDACFAIVCRVKGRLLRQSCDFEFSYQVHSVLRCGVMVDISEESISLVESDFFYQSVLRNRTNLPISLNAIRVRSWTRGDECPRIELTSEDKDLKLLPSNSQRSSVSNKASREWEITNERCLSLGTVLSPGDCYFFSSNFSEKFYESSTQPKLQSRAFLNEYLNSGRASEKGSPPKTKPAIITFQLGRSRSMWTVGSESILKSSTQAGENMHTSQLPVFLKEFLKTYDLDIFTHTILVSSPDSSPENFLHIPRNESNIDGKGSPLIESNTMSVQPHIVHMNSGLPLECSVSATFKNGKQQSELSPVKNIDEKKHTIILCTETGSPLKCTYKISFQHFGKNGCQQFKTEEKVDIARQMLISVCETDSWLPLGPVSQSFDLMSLFELNNMRYTSKSVWGTSM